MTTANRTSNRPRSIVNRKRQTQVSNKVEKDNVVVFQPTSTSQTLSSPCVFYNCKSTPLPFLRDRDIRYYVHQIFNEILANSLTLVALEEDLKQIFIKELCDVTIKQYREFLQQDQKLSTQQIKQHYKYIYDLASELLAKNMNNLEKLSDQEQDDLTLELTKSLSSFSLN